MQHHVVSCAATNHQTEASYCQTVQNPEQLPPKPKIFHKQPRQQQSFDRICYSVKTLKLLLAPYVLDGRLVCTLA